MLTLKLIINFLCPVFQCSRTETAHGRQLPAFDRHADSQDVLLHQPGPGHVPVLPH